jgi:hypothetical protein
MSICTQYLWWGFKSGGIVDTHFIDLQQKGTELYLFIADDGPQAEMRAGAKRKAPESISPTQAEEPAKRRKEEIEEEKEPMRKDPVLYKEIRSGFIDGSDNPANENPAKLADAFN